MMFKAHILQIALLAKIRFGWAQVAGG